MTTATESNRLSKSQAVARSRQKLTQAGGRRLPTGYLQPDAAAALDALLQAGYAPTATGVIASALLDARRKIARRGQ